MPGTPMYARLGLEVRPPGSASSLAVAVGGMGLTAANRTGFYAELTSTTERLGLVAGGAEVLRACNDPAAVWIEGLGYQVLANHIRVGDLPGGYAQANGDIWYDGTDLMVRRGGVDLNLTANVLPVGATTNSMLRWDGSDWTEQTALTVDASAVTAVDGGAGVDTDFQVRTGAAKLWQIRGVDESDGSNANDLIFSYDGGGGLTEWLRMDVSKSAIQTTVATVAHALPAPALSDATTGKIYFDDATNKYRVSENGGAFVDLALTAGTTTGALLSWDGSGWAENANLLLNADGSLLFDTTAVSPSHAEGTIYWDASDHTLAVMTDVSGTVLQAGQELLLRVVNATGATLNNGQVVYVDGAQGNRPTVDLADASSTASSADCTIGVVTSSSGIANMAAGYVAKTGIVRDVNTSAWSAGDKLWLSTTAGALTNVQPTSPDKGVRVGYALNSTVNGSILVDVDTGCSLADLHDVLVSSPLDGQLLAYDSASAYWANLTGLTYTAVGLTVTGQLNSTGLVQPTSTKTTAYPMVNTDHTIRADATTAAFTVTLPASPVTGQIVCVKKVDNSVNAVTIGGTVDGAVNPTLVQQYSFKTMQYNGTSWDTIG